MKGETTIQKFLSYVEIKTKITSVLTFLLVLAYLFHERIAVDWKVTLVFFLSMFLFDLTTTALNNYIDTKTNHQTLVFRRSGALAIFFVLLAMSIASGIYLVILTDIIVLLIGAVCFAAGILYTFGPVPISRLPLGEVFSGIFYGFFIPFLILYINLPSGSIMVLEYKEVIGKLYFTMSVKPILSIILLSVIPMAVTANIMLANNICDHEKDIAVKRYTLPHFIGDKAVTLFAFIYYATYAANIALVVFGILHPITLLALLTFPVVQKNINVFRKLQDKETTFGVSIINFIVIMAANILAVFVGGLFMRWF